MDKSFSRFKKNIKNPDSLVQSQFNFRCATQQSQNKTVIFKNSIPTIPQLLCQNDELKEQVETLRKKVITLKRQYKQLQLEYEAYRKNKQKTDHKEFINKGSKRQEIQDDYSIQDRIRIFQNAMKDLTFQRNTFPIEESDTQSLQKNKRNIFQKNRSSLDGDMKNPIKSVSLRKNPFHSQEFDSRHSEKKTQQKFYSFCKNEIIKTKAENSSLQTQIKELKGRIHRAELEKSQIKSFLQQKQVRISKLTRENQKVQDDLKQKDQLIIQQRRCLEDSRLYNSYNPKRLSQTKLINQKTDDKEVNENINNQNLVKQLQQCKRKLIDHVKVKDDNYKLRNQVAELTLKCTQFFQKSYRFGANIDHLWQIKKIEYLNMHKILQDCHKNQQN